MATQALRHDQSGRLTDTGADLGKVDLGTGTKASSAAQRWAKSFGDYRACHVLAKILGGPGGRTAGNVVPCTDAANKIMERLEMQVRGSLRAGHEARVDVHLKYYPGNKTAVPDEIIYTWQVFFGPSRPQTRTIRNVQ